MPFDLLNLLLWRNKQDLVASSDARDRSGPLSPHRHTPVPPPLSVSFAFALFYLIEGSDPRRHNKLSCTAGMRRWQRSAQTSVNWSCELKPQRQLLCKCFLRSFFSPSLVLGAVWNLLTQIMQVDLPGGSAGFIALSPSRMAAGHICWALIVQPPSLSQTVPLAPRQEHSSPPFTPSFMSILFLAKCRFLRLLLLLRPSSAQTLRTLASLNSVRLQGWAYRS